VASSTAAAAAVLNRSGSNPFPTPTVDIGHYEFASSTASPGVFTPNNSSQLNRWQFAGATLNGNTAFINAVGVTISLNNVPSFFSKIFGYSSLAVAKVQAVAYIGFSGSLPEGGIPSYSPLPMPPVPPIAICKQSITDASGNYKWQPFPGFILNNNSLSPTGVPTAAWTNFAQPCQGAASDSSVEALIPPSGSNPQVIVLGPIATTAGTTYADNIAAFYSYWQSYESGLATPQPLFLILPVIDCSGGVSNCPPVVGAVDANVIWVNDVAGNAQYPMQMGNWVCPSSCSPVAGQFNQCCWNSFVSYFNLYQPDGVTPATYAGQTIYFETLILGLGLTYFQGPIGKSGGQDFGILAQYPVLVNALRFSP
jgi:hypothetical protein